VKKKRDKNLDDNEKKFKVKAKDHDLEKGSGITKEEFVGHS